MVAAGYTLEVAILCTLVVIGWPLAISQLLVVRFTPKRKRVTLKTFMLFSGILALIATSIRASDASSVFNRIPRIVSTECGATATAGVFYASSAYVIGSARSLHKQVHQSIPSFLAPMMFISVMIWQAIHTIVLLVQWQMMQHPDKYSRDSLVSLTILMDLTVDFETVFLVSIGCYLFLTVRKKIQASIQKLAEQAAYAEELLQMANETAEHANMTTAATGGGQKSGGGGGKEQMNDTKQPLFFQTRIVQQLSDAAEGDETGPAAAASTPAAAGKKSSHASSSARYATATIHPAPFTAPSSPTSGTHVFTPAPLISPAVATMSAIGAAASAAVAQAGLHELSHAVRKVTLMTLCAVILCIATVANSFNSLKKGFNKELDVSESDPEEYDSGFLIPSCIHMLCVFVILWYTWSRPAVWMSARVRRGRQTPFWRTLWHGPPTPLAFELKRNMPPPAAAVGQTSPPQLTLHQPDAAITIANE